MAIRFYLPVLLCLTTAFGQQAKPDRKRAPIVQPGAPGKPAKTANIMHQEATAHHLPDQRLPFSPLPALASAEHRKIVVAECDGLVIGLARKKIDNMDGAKALTSAADRLKYHAGFCRAIKGFSRCKADIAVTARRRGLAEI